MNATLKTKASFTWQSIMAGVETFRRGYIWNDPWIPQSASKMILTVRGNNLLSRVSDLIDPGSGDWDEQLVRQTFWPVDTHRILAIPLPIYDMTNFVAWSPSRHWCTRVLYKREKRPFAIASRNRHLVSVGDWGSSTHTIQKNGMGCSFRLEAIATNIPYVMLFLLHTGRTNESYVLLIFAACIWIDQPCAIQFGIYKKK